jgi:hypothetical protein
MQEKLYRRSRMWGVEVQMQVSLNVELAIHNLETLRFASISTIEYQQINTSALSHILISVLLPLFSSLRLRNFSVLKSIILPQRESV